jgi:sugar/nucleoside kinase (ribokinase family)
VCNTLAVAAALGARVGGVVACGGDYVGKALREIVTLEGIDASFIETSLSPTTVTLSSGVTRSSIMGKEGEREQHLRREDVSAAWYSLNTIPSWVFLTLPAVDSPAGEIFLSLARKVGASIAVTLSSANQVRERASRLAELLCVADLVLANADEAAALDESGTIPGLMLETRGSAGARVLRNGVCVLSVEIPLQVPVVDTTGAGDAFAAGVLSVLDPSDLCDDNLLSAVLLGHKSAGVIVSRLGSQPGSDGQMLLRDIGRAHGL